MKPKTTKPRSSTELIELYSRARVIRATPVDPVAAHLGKVRELTNADAREQVHRLK